MCSLGIAAVPAVHTLTTDAGYTTGSANPTNFAEYGPFIREAGKRGME